MYLVVLALLFSFIPSDFVDSVLHSDRSMQQVMDNTEVQRTRANLLFLKFLENDEFVYNDTKSRMIAVEDRSSEVIRYIKALRKRLLEADDVNEYGYLSGGKREELSNDLMIDGHHADSLMMELHSFKESIASYVPLNKQVELDSLLPLPATVTRSNGQNSSTEDFYFAKTPLNISLLNLSHFEAQVQQTKSFALDQILSDAFRSKEDQLPVDVKTIFRAPEKQFEGETAIRDFFSQLEVAELLTELRRKKRESNAYLHVQSLTDSIYPAGRPLRFKVYFDSVFTEKVNVKVSSQYGFTEYVLHRPGDFLYVPEKKGSYSLTFSNQKFRLTKSFSVIDVEPILQNEKYGTLYVGVDNALRIETSEFEDTRNLIARTNNGRVIKRGKNFYVRVEDKKLTHVEVYARMPYGIVKIAEKEFLVKDAEIPRVFIGNADNEEKASADIIQKADRIRMDDQAIEEGYEVASYQLSLIFNDHTSITPPVGHNSALLSSEAKGILARVSPGDIVLLEDVKLRGPQGGLIDAGNHRIVVQ